MQLLDRRSFEIDYVTFVSPKGGTEPFRRIVEQLGLKFIREDTGVLTINELAFAKSMTSLYELHIKSLPVCRKGSENRQPVCYRRFYELFHLYAHRDVFDLVVSMYGTLSGYDIVVFANSRSVADKILVRVALLAGARAVVMELPNLFPVEGSRATAAIAPSYFVLKHPSVQHSEIERLYLIHPGVNTSMFRPRLSKEEPTNASTVTIGFLGRITTEKSIGLYLRMAQHLAQNSNLCKSKSCEFIVVGAGEILEASKLYAKALGVNIKFLGARYSGIPSLLASFDVLVNPSLRSSETFCIVNIEAMAAGVPVGTFRSFVVLDNNHMCSQLWCWRGS